MREDGKIPWCDARDSMLRELFDTISGLLLPASPQRSNAARVRNMSRFNGGQIQNNFSKSQKIKQFLEREALNVEYL